MRIFIFAKRCGKEILRDPLNLVFGLGFPIVLLLLLTAIQANVPVDLFQIQTLAPGVAVFGLSFGVIGCLIFGGGLSMVLLNIEQLVLQVCGGVLCVVGIVVMALTYPLRRALERRLKEKHKEEIVQLCKSVLDGEK